MEEGNKSKLFPSGIRDPIHEWIPISETEKHLLDSRYVQRLRRVKQLEFVSLDYPGGEHSRFGHSLGAMHLAGEFCTHLWPGDPQKIKLIRVAALLHDIAHGPFSHAWDRAVYSGMYKSEKGHDLHRIYLLENCEDLRDRVKNCGITPEDIIKIWKEEKTAEHDVIQGEMGADRMDYMLRDSYFTGMKHFGAVSPKRLISKSYIKDGRVHFSETARDEIDMALKGRDLLYKNVYKYKQSNEASKLVEIMIRRAIDGGLPFEEMTRDVEQFVRLDDYSVFGMINFDPRSTSKEAKEIADRLNFRDLTTVTPICDETPSNYMESLHQAYGDWNVLEKGFF